MTLSPRAVALQGIGFGARLVALQGFLPLVVVDTKPVQGAGPEKTSRYSDDRAYDPDRVRERLAKVVIRGKEYDPFDPRLIDILEQEALRPEPDLGDELARQERKLSRKIVVKSGTQDIVVPVFRPMIKQMPSFQQASVEDFEAYAKKAAEAASDERRRIMLILVAADA